MTFAKALDRMPQKSAMLLIEEVLSANEIEITCKARDHTGADYPLRIDGTLHTISLVELGAQAAAAHASLVAIGDNHAGLILALHGIEVTERDLRDTKGQLDVSALQLHFDETGARYSFEIFAGGRPILKGQAMLKMEAVAR